MISTCGASAGDQAAAARPSASARSAVRNSPTAPRTPSVPKSRRSSGTAPTRRKLTLGELRALTGLLQASLLALLRARVAREEAAALELAAQVGIGLHESARHAVAEGAGLGGHPAAVDARDHVHALLVARRLERCSHRLLEGGAREEVLERAAVHLVLAGAGLEDHARDGGLALAGGLVTRVGRELLGRARGGLRLGRSLHLSLCLSLSNLGFRICAGGVIKLVVGSRWLLLGQDRLEVLAGDHLALGLLHAALAALGRLAARAARLLGGLLEGVGQVLAVLALDLERVRLELLGGLLAQGVIHARRGRLAARLRRGHVDLGRLFLEPGGLLGRHLLRLGSLVLAVLGGVAPLFLDQAFTSIGCGFCAACGWSGPA